MNTGKILAVDDTPASLRLLTDILRIEGYDVRSAISGELALHSASSDPPDLVLLDVRMSGMDGFELCRRLKAQPETRDIPVIFVSAAMDMGDKVQGFAMGGVDYVTKPYQDDELLARVRAHLELNSLRHHLEDSVKERTAKLNETLIALQQSEKRLHAIIDTSMDAIVQMDVGGVIIGWNRQAEETFGWPGRQVIGQSLVEIIIPAGQREAHVRGLKRFLQTAEGPVLNKRIEVEGLHRDGREFSVELTVVPIKIGEQYEFSSFLRDISQKKQAEQVIWKQANFDSLTGLPNRHMFHERLEYEVHKAQRTRLPLALMMIDLDHFKAINDMHGHDMGDVLLVEAARRISECVRITDTVARLGGDEFVAILPELDDMDGVERIAQCIVEKVSAPYQLKDECGYVSASIGITLCPEDAETVTELLKNADRAMYAAKSLGRNRHNYFTPLMQEALLTRQRLINDLHCALADNQFKVYFQPIVELATNQINKAEALARWQHPERGLISTADFIELAEETGLILEIGDWVFQESMRWVKRWRTMYNAKLQISVNKSPIQFYKNGNEHPTWQSYLRKLDLPGQSLDIEITEAMLLDSNISVTSALLTLRNSDIQVSIDDFAAGYSSLSYLKKFAIDYLKIDKALVHNLTSVPNDLALSEAIVAMAHKLGIKVIAEGVETQQQHDLLSAAGCDYAQGYLYSRPIPPDQFEELLKRV